MAIPAEQGFRAWWHSLPATRVVRQLHTAFQAELPLRCLFGTLTMAGRAKRIEVIGRSNPVPSMAMQGLDELHEGRS